MSQISQNDTKFLDAAAQAANLNGHSFIAWVDSKGAWESTCSQCHQVLRVNAQYEVFGTATLNPCGGYAGSTLVAERDNKFSVATPITVIGATLWQALNPKKKEGEHD